MIGEPKYRVWEIEAKFMTEQVCGLEWSVAGCKWYGPGVGSGWCYLDPDFDWSRKTTTPKPKHVDILMQCTGLNDKKGVKDFVGDVWEVEYEGKKVWFVREVELTWCGYAFKFRCLDGEVSPVHANVDEEGVIIGNIHQSPELLKGNSNE